MSAAEMEHRDEEFLEELDKYVKSQIRFPESTKTVIRDADYTRLLSIVEKLQKSNEAKDKALEVSEKALEQVFNTFPSEATVGNGIKWRKLSMTAKLISHEALAAIRELKGE